jgi:cell wall-associated NlpC family hydrolase
VCTTTAAVAQEPPAAAPVPPSRLTVGQDAWVAVSVARLWTTPTAPRPVDRPALQRPVRTRAWLAAMTLAQRRALYHRSDTEALLGERVRVVRLRNGWARVAVPDQPSPKDRRGYPGWVPTRQLTARQPTRSARVVTVTARTTWLRTDDLASTRVLEISFGTNLAYVGSVGRQVQVRTLLGAVRRVRAGAVSVHPRSDPALPRTRRDVLHAAQAFSGLPYLWGGLSGFGLDCSGLTWLDYRAHGQRIPRDAAPQARHGSPLRFADLRRGDLLFYATNGLVHHVTMYAGDHKMVQAPHTGGVVETSPVSRSGYAGARRYLR